MQRIMVDLPDPEGPQTTTLSLAPTERLTSRSTWNSPYHLLTLRRSMIGPWEVLVAASAGIMIAFPGLSLVAARELGLEVLAVLRHREAEQEVDDRNKDVGFETEATPCRLVDG